MKKILIALDYDPSAQTVAEKGYELANAMHAEVTLLHVISDVMHYSYLEYSPILGFEGFNSIDKTQREMAVKLEERAQEFLDKTKKGLGDENIKTIVKNGEFGETIVAPARDINADIIVMGTHHRSGLEKFFMGSVAEHVLHHSSIPMLIIPTTL